METPWEPDATHWNKTDWNSKDLFHHWYAKEPHKNENICCLNRAGTVLNAVFILYPPPTNLDTEEWQHLLDAAKILLKKDASLTFGLNKVLGLIREANSHLFDK